MSKSCQDFENRKVDRRQLLHTLGLMAAATSIGRSVAHAQEPARTPAPPRLNAGPRMDWLKESYPRSGPFTTVSIGHIAYSTPDQRKARAWYVDLLGMLPVFDQGSSTALRFGVPWNHIYVTQNRDKTSRGNISHMSYNIEKFRLESVEAELTARGLFHSYDGPFMIHTDDPEKFRLQPAAMTAVFPGGANSDLVDGLGEEEGLKNHLREAPRPTYKAFTASCMNHISHNCADYGKVRDYYVDLWGMRKVSDDGKVAVVEFGGKFGDPPQQIWLRGGLKPGQAQYIDHIGYSIENFDSSRVEAELKKRSLNPRSAGPNAWAIDDVAGYPIQICAERGVVPAEAYKPYASA